jgi:hypothetical protein
MKCHLPITEAAPLPSLLPLLKTLFQPMSAPAQFKDRDVVSRAFADLSELVAGAALVDSEMAEAAAHQ